MIEEALQFITDLSEKAKEARLLNIPGDGRKVFIDQGGSVTQYDVTTEPRNHTVRSVDDLINAAQRWNKNPVIWINGENIVLIADDDDRLDTVELKLVKSNAFSTLCKLETKPVLSQKELIRMLRVDLLGTLNRADLLTAVKSIKFRTLDAGTSLVQQGSESLGRTIENEVTGAGDIPELVAVNCPVFSNPGEDQHYEVQCDLEVVPAEQKFLFRPIPDEIQKITDAALADIRDRIQSDLKDMPIFFGTP